ncbi:MAG: hypothetical protein NTU83_14770, partial [Candidatus Hydrogenedentes bacterium]|nr:hypothetical protein [Candidatus Hydrogenedentota bacterium]
MRRPLQYHSMWVVVVALGLMVASGTVLAAPNGITYQGTLANPAGNAIPTGAYPMTFSIWDALTVGAKLWEETGHTVTVTKGAFTVELGQATSFGTIFDGGAPRWLEISVNRGSGLQTFAPRVSFTMVPFARKATMAGDADTVDGLHALAFSLTGHVHDWAGITGKPATFTPSAHAHSGADITSGKVGNAYLNTGTGNGLDADLLDGSHASAFATTSHNHDGAAITTGKVNNARLNTGTGNGLDADTVDTKHASDFAAASHTQAWSTITSVPAGALDLSGTYPNLTVVGLRGNPVNTGVPSTGQVLKWTGTAWGPGTDADTIMTNADTLDTLHASAFSLTGHVHDWTVITGKPTTFTPSAHVHSGADITSGKVANAYLNTGTGLGLDADFLDGSHASAFSLTGHVHDRTVITGG